MVLLALRRSKRHDLVLEVFHRMPDLGVTRNKAHVTMAVGVIERHDEISHNNLIFLSSHI
jgi:pentatricopeptide repeat protein